MIPYISEIRIFGFGIIPKGWAPCNGQILPVNANTALFSLLGNMYGGDGVNTFALPNLQGKTALHVGSGFTQGNWGGEATHVLALNEMPQHTHAAIGSSNSPNASTPQNNFWPSNTGHNPYGTPGATMMSSQAIASNGAGQAHNNMSPYLVLNICISLTGVYPPRN